MIPDENNLGKYVRHLRDHGLADAVGDWKEASGIRTFGIRVGGVFYPIPELRDAKNRAAVLSRDFVGILLNRASAAMRKKRRTHPVRKAGDYERSTSLAGSQLSDDCSA